MVYFKIDKDMPPIKIDVDFIKGRRRKPPDPFNWWRLLSALFYVYVVFATSWFTWQLGVAFLLWVDQTWAKDLFYLFNPKGP